MMESLFAINQKGVRIATTSAVLIVGPACPGENNQDSSNFRKRQRQAKQKQGSQTNSQGPRDMVPGQLLTGRHPAL